MVANLQDRQRCAAHVDEATLVDLRNRGGTQVQLLRCTTGKLLSQTLVLTCEQHTGALFPQDPAEMPRGCRPKETSQKRPTVRP